MLLTLGVEVLAVFPGVFADARKMLALAFSAVTVAITRAFGGIIAQSFQILLSLISFWGVLSNLRGFYRRACQYCRSSCHHSIHSRTCMFHHIGKSRVPDLRKASCWTCGTHQNRTHRTCQLYPVRDIFDIGIFHKRNCQIPSTVFYLHSKIVKWSLESYFLLTSGSMQPSQTFEVSVSTSHSHMFPVCPEGQTHWPHE